MVAMLALDYTVKTGKSSIPDPPGFSASSSTSSRDLAKKSSTDVIASANKATSLKLRRAWDMALAPAKNLPMQAIMLYFSGSGIQIFSLGMIFMLVTGPITAVAGIFKAFESLRPTPPAKDGKEVEEPSYAPLMMPMLTFVACQGLVFALGLYKCSTMGILPTGSGDWLQFETRLEPPEWSAIRSLSLG